MATDKGEAIDIIEVPYFKQQVDAGLRDVAEGRTLSHEELKKTNREVAEIRWSLAAERDLQEIEDFILGALPQ